MPSLNAWTWFVRLDDGRVICPPYPDGFGALPLSRVRTLVVHDNSGLPERRHIVHLRDGMRPIFFARRRRAINVVTDDIVSDEPIAIGFGWQMTLHVGRETRNVMALTWILADGRMQHTNGDVDELGISLTGDANGE